jgi:hypothetical protein
MGLWYRFCGDLQRKHVPAAAHFQAEVVQKLRFLNNSIDKTLLLPMPLRING